MNSKQFAAILAVLLLIELATARTVRLYETIIKANGDRIVREWSSDDGDETESNLKNNVEYGADDFDLMKTASLISDFGRDYIGQHQGNDIETWPAAQQQITGELTRVKPYGVHVPLVSTGSFNGTQIIFIGNEPDSLRGWEQRRWQHESRNQNIPTNDKSTSDAYKEINTETKNDSLDELLPKLFPTKGKTPNDAEKEINPETKNDSLDELLAKLFKTEEITMKPAKKSTIGPFISERFTDFDQDYQILEVSNEANFLKLEDIR